MPSSSHYDVAVIGAGMSGLAAGIRLAHFGRRVCIFERHYAPGGLNSFYRLGGRNYDVGLHAMTNYVPPGVKGTPLGKILRQLRIDRDELGLCPQKQSRIAFGPQGETSLRFTNDSAVLEEEIAAKFPTQIDGFRRLAALTGSYEDLALDAPAASARAVVRQHITDPLLEDMLLCPLLYYGSAQAHDVDFTQFRILFKAVFREGLARPYEGVRQVIRVLLEKYRAAGGERRMNCGVARIREAGGRATGLQLDDGEEISADHVIASIGALETRQLLARPADGQPRASALGATERLSFVESIRVLQPQPRELGWGSDTIVFFNDSARFEYARPAGQVDTRSGVICLPNNFDFGDRELPEGQLRITCLANYDQWAGLPEDQYRADKARWLDEATRSACRFLPPVPAEALATATVACDIFTPRTIERFTGHLQGAVYGAAQKIRDGRTDLKNLYLCGTDQGLLGIVGAMLSGITMANRHILQPGARG
ncbi:MAG TPA: NAD(P)/FAD-dependent oxidoreductase [Opitutaceae bacterium]|nr:NAD(P)/FAD-dependent oxidoreductase [Opitutaceae bacterium]